MKSVSTITAILLCVWLFLPSSAEAQCNCANAPKAQYKLVPVQAPPVCVVAAQPLTVQVRSTKTLFAPAPGWEWVVGPLGGHWLRPVRQVVASNPGVQTFRLQSAGGCANGNCPAK
jgi:hypothetical protein